MQTTVFYLQKQGNCFHIKLLFLTKKLKASSSNRKVTAKFPCDYPDMKPEVKLRSRLHSSKFSHFVS